MSEITKPIMLDETGKEIVEALKGISRHAETADMASDSEKLGGKEPSEYLGTGDVPEWAKQPNKPTYTASEVGALSADGKAVDSDKLNGHPASDFATVMDIDNYKENGYLPKNLIGLDDNTYYPCNISTGIVYSVSKADGDAASDARAISFYDENKNYITDLTIANYATRTLTYPSGRVTARYVKWSDQPGSRGKIYAVMLEYGQPTHYVPYAASNAMLTDEVNGTKSMISDNWDATKTYSVGNFCIYQNTLYECLVQNSGQNPLTATTYWQMVKVTDVVSGGNSYRKLTAESSGSVRLPASFNEILVIVSMLNETRRCTINIPYAELSETDKYYTAGFYASSSANVGYCVTASTSIVNKIWNFSNGTQQSDFIMDVYVR